MNELRRAKDVIFRRMQMEAFPEEYHALSAGNPVKKSSAIITFGPCIDDVGLIRPVSRFLP